MAEEKPEPTQREAYAEAAACLRSATEVDLDWAAQRIAAARAWIELAQAMRG